MTRVNNRFIYRMIGPYARLLTLIFGSIIVLTWTLYRHLTNGVNFDVVGQIGLSLQWLDGRHAGAQLGTTNYVVKMPLYLLVNSLHWLTPMHRLLFLAAICNLLTFWLLFVLFESFLRLYNVPRRGWFYLAYIWLTTIAGSVFWIDYANSRNLETVGGLFFVYCGLRFLIRGGRWPLVSLFLVGGLVFFADTLQLYVCGGGLCVYALTRALRRHRRHETFQTAWLLSATAGAFVLSKALFFGAAHTLHINFLRAPSTQPHLDKHVLNGMAQATLRIFGADFLRRPYGIASLRELLNAVILAAIILGLLQLLRKKILPAPFKLWCCVIALNYAAYAASGQVALWATERYLLMVPIVVALLVALTGNSLRLKHPLRWQYGWLALSLLAYGMLIGALLHAWPTRHTKDSHIYSLNSFLQSHHDSYALAGRETGITGTYFSNDTIRILPMGCDSDHTLQPTTLFYDQAAFYELEYYHGDVPIILQDNKVTFGGATCTEANIVAQFGAPKAQMNVPGYGTEIVYDAATLTKVLHHATAFLMNPFQNTPMNYAKLPQNASLANCSKGVLDVIMAHPDDDILFTNPDLSDHLKPDHCVRSVYITSGDDGRHNSYWLDRERGIQAAYAFMLGAPDNWNTAAISVNGQRVTIASLQHNPSVSLMFVRLPDGGVSGSGFADTGHVSLKKAEHMGTSLKTIDGEETFTYSQLQNVLADIIASDHPQDIYTHVIAGPYINGDHSDHTAVGKLVVRAAVSAQTRAMISTYVGYPDNSLPPNLPADIRTYKRAIFSVYALHDHAICQTDAHCTIDDTYSKYFSRRYKQPGQ